MPQFRLSDNIVLKNKEYPVSELTQSLAKLEPKKILEFFFSQNITGIARVRRIRLLKDVLFPYVVKTRQKLQSLASELNYRLSWFRIYSEYELENLLIYFNSKALNRQYLDELWCLFLNVMKENNVPDSDILKLVKQAEKSTYEPVKAIHEFNKGIWPLFKDPENVLDGLTPEEFRPVLFNSSTVKEIRELGKKYDVNVPFRLRKKQFIENIVEELKKRNEFDLDVEKEIEAKNVIQLERFCIDRKIPISSELKKEEIIEYILSHAAQTKGSYFVPEDHLGYELTLDEVTKNQEVDADAPELTTRQFDSSEIQFKEYVLVNFDEVDLNNSDLSISNFDEEPQTEVLETVEEVKEEPSTVEVIEEVKEEPVFEIKEEEVSAEPQTEVTEVVSEVKEEPTTTEVIEEVLVVEPTANEVKDTAEETSVSEPKETKEETTESLGDSADSSTEEITKAVEPTVIEEDSNLTDLTEPTTEPTMPEEIILKDGQENSSGLVEGEIQDMETNGSDKVISDVNNVSESFNSDKNVSETHTKTENEIHNITRNITTNYITNTKNNTDGKVYTTQYSESAVANTGCCCQCCGTKYSDHEFHNMVINGGYFNSNQKVIEADEKEAYKVFSLAEKEAKKPRAIENQAVLPVGYYIQPQQIEDRGWFNRLLAFLVFLGLLIATVSFILLYFDVLKL